MAQTLTFDTGVREYDINGVATVRFNPGDSDFAGHVFNVLRDLEERTPEFQKRVDEIEIGENGEGGEEMFAYAKERDAEMRGIIDGLFGQEGLADALFPDMSCYALSDGVPVWINFFLAIANEISEAFGKADGQDPRTRNISDKSAALLEKYRKATTKR